MLEYLKNYYVCMLVLLVFSFLVPREDYKAYIQFFVGIFLVVLLLQPVLSMVSFENSTEISQLFDDINKQIEQMDFGKGDNIYEHFFSKGEGE